MNFLYPQFLFGLFALAIPIIIHLFNFRKTKKVYFSNNQFLKNVKEVSSAKLKLKHLLVLAARLLFIFFLVLTFAQPVIPDEEGSEMKSNVHIYVDNSMSMSNEIASDLSAFDQATNYVNEIVGLYPPNTKYKLLTNDFASFSNQYKNKDDIKERITEINLSGISREMNDIYSRITTGDLVQREEKDIYIISDFQKSTSPSLEMLTADTTDNIYLVPLQYKNQGNVFVDSVFLANPFLIADNSNEVGVILRNTGNEDIDDLILKLFINDSQVASTSINIKANATNAVNFKLNFDLNAINMCRISFEEFPVSYDNDFYFTLNIGDKINILEIKNNNASEVIEKVYGNQSIFNFYSYNSNNMDYSQLNSVDLVILNELNKIDPAFIPYLNNFLKNEGNLLVIFPAHPDLESYNQIITGRNLSQSGRVNKSELEKLDMENPFFTNIFENTEEVISMPEARNSVTWSGSADALLSYKNGEPFLSSVSRSNIYLLGAPLDNEFTNFHNQAIFVPVMYRIAALSKSINEKFYYTMDETLMVLTVDSVSANDNFKLRNKEEEVIPAQRFSGSKLFLEVPKNTLSPGFYEFVLKDKVHKILAFNYNEKESLLEQHAENNLITAFAGQENVRVYETDDIKTFTAALTQNNTGNALWKYTLILALLFLFAEVLLLRLL